MLQSHETEKKRGRKPSECRSEEERQREEERRSCVRFLKVGSERPLKRR